MVFYYFGKGKHFYKIVKPKPSLFHRTLNFIVSNRTFLFPELLMQVQLLRQEQGSRLLKDQSTRPSVAWSTCPPLTPGAPPVWISGTPECREGFCQSTTKAFHQNCLRQYFEYSREPGIMFLSPTISLGFWVHSPGIVCFIFCLQQSCTNCLGSEPALSTESELAPALGDGPGQTEAVICCQKLS